MTRTFKIPLVTSRDGKDWSAQGWGTEASGDVSVEDAMAAADDCVDASDRVQIVVTVTVNIPEPPCVEGTAEVQDA